MRTSFPTRLPLSWWTQIILNERTFEVLPFSSTWSYTRFWKTSRSGKDNSSGRVFWADFSVGNDPCVEKTEPQPYLNSFFKIHRELERRSERGAAFKSLIKFPIPHALKQLTAKPKKVFLPESKPRNLLNHSNMHLYATFRGLLLLRLKQAEKMVRLISPSSH